MARHKKTSCIGPLSKSYTHPLNTNLSAVIEKFCEISVPRLVPCVIICKHQAVEYRFDCRGWIVWERVLECEVRQKAFPRK